MKSSIVIDRIIIIDINWNSINFSQVNDSKSVDSTQLSEAKLIKSSSANFN